MKYIVILTNKKTKYNLSKGYTLPIFGIRKVINSIIDNKILFFLRDRILYNN